MNTYPIGFNAIANAGRVGDENYYLGVVKQIKSAWQMVISNPDLASKVYEACEGQSNVIYRSFGDGDNDFWREGRKTPQQYANELMALKDTRLWLHALNEPNPDKRNPDEVQRCNDWLADVVRIVCGAGRKLIVGNFAAGSYELLHVGMGLYDNLLRTIHEYQHICHLGLHEYSAVFIPMTFDSIKQGLRKQEYITPDKWLYLDDPNEDLRLPDYRVEQLDWMYHLFRSNWLQHRCKNIGIEPVPIVLTEFGTDRLPDLEGENDIYEFFKNTYGVPTPYAAPHGFYSNYKAWEAYFPQWSTDQALFEQLKWARLNYDPTWYKGILLFMWGNDEEFSPRGFNVAPKTELHDYLIADAQSIGSISVVDPDSGPSVEEEIPDPTSNERPAATLTPFDNRINLVYFHDGTLSTRSIDESAKYLRERARTVSGVMIKAINGTRWQGTGRSDPKAVTGIRRLEEWVNSLTLNGLDAHVWGVPRGKTPQSLEEEIARYIRIAEIPNVKSILYDIEPYEHYWEGTPELARHFAKTIRESVREDLHIGLITDARHRNNFPRILDPFAPYIESIHPMIYPVFFGCDQNMRECIKPSIQNLIPYNKPIIPMLQSYYENLVQKRPTPEQIIEQASISFELGAYGISYFRIGDDHGADGRPHMGDAEYVAISNIETPILPPRPEIVSTTVDNDIKPVTYTWQQLINAIATVAPRHGLAWQDWFDSEGLVNDFDNSKRSRTYDGKPIHEWQIIDQSIKDEIYQELGIVNVDKVVKPKKPSQPNYTWQSVVNATWDLARKYGMDWDQWLQSEKFYSSFTESERDQPYSGIPIAFFRHITKEQKQELLEILKKPKATIDPKPKPSSSERISSMIGIHGAPGTYAPNQQHWGTWTKYLKQMGVKWYKQCDYDRLDNDIFQWVLHLQSIGITPIVRYLVNNQFPNGLPDSFFKKMKQYVAQGIVLAEIGNEPNLDHEWEGAWKGSPDGVAPRMAVTNPEAVRLLADTWIRDAERCVSIGARPALYAFAPTDWRGNLHPSYSSVLYTDKFISYLSQHYRQRTIELFNKGAWIAVHSATYEQALNFDPFSVSPAWDMTLQSYMVPIRAFEKHFGRDIDITSIDIISTEGGVFTPNVSYGHRPEITPEQHANDVVAMYRWLAENSPLKAMCPWCISADSLIGVTHSAHDFRNDGWIKEINGRLSPLPVVRKLGELKTEITASNTLAGENSVRLNVPYISQNDPQAPYLNDCGPTCLAMILHAEPNANDIPVYKLYEYDPLMSKKNDFTTLGDLKKVGSELKLGFIYRSQPDTSRTNAIDVIKESLAQNRPMILLINRSKAPYGSSYEDYGHFIVITGIDDNFIYASDPLPASDNREKANHPWSYDEILNAWEDPGPGNSTSWQCLIAQKEVSRV